MTTTDDIHEFIDFIIDNVNLRSCASTADIIYCGLHNKWSQKFIKDEQYLNLNPDDFHVNNNNTFTYEVIDNVVRLVYEKNEYLRQYHHNSRIIGETPKVITNICKELVDNNKFISVGIDFHDDPDGHEFIIVKSHDGYLIVDSFVVQRKLEKRPFSFEEFSDFLIAPTKDKYEKLFNCARPRDIPAIKYNIDISYKVLI